MTINYGETLRKIRTDFSMTQAELSQGIINRASLAKFEKEQMSIPIDQFHQLLERVDISFQEFLYLTQNYRLTAKEKIIKEFLTLSNRPTKVELTTLIIRCENVNQNLKNRTINQIKLLCQTALHYLEYQEFDHNFKDFWEKLENKNRWHYIDILLLRQMILLFPTALSVQVYQDILKYLTKYQHFNESDLLFATVHLNFSELLIQEKNRQLAISSLTIAQKYAHKTHRYDILATCFIRLGMLKNNPGLIEKGFNILELTQEFGLRKVLLKELEDYQQGQESE